jgi:tetratricopeptide (TPR) repeat protein
MALFGAPIAHEDHAVRACYAALAMQAAVQRYAEEVRRTHGLTVQMRVGLNSGEVVVRTIGNDLHMDYSAVGQTTHLAARMEQLATPGSILLTATTLRLVEGLVRVNALGPVPVKGVADPVEVFELRETTAVRGRLQAATVRGLTRFVGRQTELEALRQALVRAGVGQGQVVAVVGEAGVGKSRLIYEFLRSHHTQGWLVLESASVSYGKATPYFPIIDLLQRYAHVEERDDPRTIRAKVTGQVLTLDETLQETIPALLALLEVLPEDSPFRQLEPLQRRQRTLAALKRVLLRESQGQPLLLIFEDLHWIDSETHALLDSLIESLPTAQLLLLVNYRPEYQHSWGRKTYYTQLRLDPLPPASADEVLQALLGDDPSLATLKQLLIARTEGNPFFLEESVRTLVETGVLVGAPGAYRLAQTLPTIQVPATVQAVLAARIDRLPPEEKRLLQTAAVIGTEVPLPLLQAIAELPQAALHSGLAHLQAAEFLYETSLFPERLYTFKHALTHAVAYGSLLQERRRLLHAGIVESLEHLVAERLAEHVERLAHHAVRGEVWDKVLRYCQQAGKKTLARSANQEAVTYFEQALVAVQHLPEARETLQRAIDLRLDLRGALWRLGELERVFEYLREAEILAAALDDPHRLGRVSSQMSFSLWLIGDHDRAVEACQRAFSLAEALQDISLQVETTHHLGRVCVSLGNYPQAMDCFQENIATLKGDQLRAHFGERFSATGWISVQSHTWLSRCLAERGAFVEGIAHGEEGLRVAEGTDDTASLIAVYRDLGHLYLCKGDLHKAIPVLERGLAFCQRRDIPAYFPIVTALLGSAYALSGHPTKALPLLEQAMEQGASMRLLYGQSLETVLLGEAYLLTDRMEEARQLALRAHELSHDRKERGYQAYTLRLLGEIAAHRKPV